MVKQQQYEENQTKNPNLSVITEQGDLGLGTRELSDEEQKQVERTQSQSRQFVRQNY